MTHAPINVRPHVCRRRAELVISLTGGVALALAANWIATDPMGRAVWSVFAVVIALPLAWRNDGINSTTERRPRKDVDLASYGIACLAIASGTLFTSGVLPMLVVASIAFSLAGLLALLTSFRIPAVLAIGFLIAHSILFLNWPVWGSHWMVRHEVQWLVDSLVRVGPLFAINTAIDPTDPLTHRPMAYRLTNLGQDIPYALPTTIWPCVILHMLAGAAGLVCSMRGKVMR